MFNYILGAPLFMLYNIFIFNFPIQVFRHPSLREGLGGLLDYFLASIAWQAVIAIM